MVLTADMKELRFAAAGVWHVAFAFDLQRQAILLIAKDVKTRRPRAKV